MRDIRPIQRQEADVFLKLLCDVFGLDIRRAKDVFFTEPLFDLSRKWALFEKGEMVSILTTTPLEFGWGKAFGVAGVATRKRRQREGLASLLLQEVIRLSEQFGETGALLFAKDGRVYEKNGFTVADRVIRASLRLEPTNQCYDSMPFSQVKQVYDEWAAESPNRLRRDEKRWAYWKWHYRICSEYSGGYLCSEPGVLREAIYAGVAHKLPLSSGTDWFGTETVSQLLNVPIFDRRSELLLMGRGIPAAPEMFMTDQF